MSDITPISASPSGALPASTPGAEASPRPVSGGSRAQSGPSTARDVQAEAPAPTPVPARAPLASEVPAWGAGDAQALVPLLDLVRLGYYKGIVQWLDDWVRQHPEQAVFAQGIRTMAREFRFEAIEQRLLQAGVPSRLPTEPS